MISVDDVTLTGTVPENLRVAFRSLEAGQRLTCVYRQDHTGRHQRWDYTWRPGLVVGWCEATRALEYKISVPRLGGQAANWPLPIYDSVEDWPLDTACRDVLRALGLTSALKEEPDPVLALGVPAAGVRRIAYAFDHLSTDVPGTFHALAFLRRRGKLPERFDQTGLQWSLSGWYRTQFYDKAAELLQNRLYTKSLREELASDAKGVLRMEVTLGSPERVRELVGLPSGALPTLPLMARPEVAARALRREVYGALHVDQLVVAQTEEQGVAGRAAEVAKRLGKKAGAGIRAQLVLIPMLEASGMGDEAIMTILNMKRRAQLDLRRRELRDLGYIGPSDLHGRKLLRDLLGEFRRQVPDDEHPWTLTAEEALRYAVAAPWAPEDEADVRDDGSARGTADIDALDPEGLFSVEEYDPDAGRGEIEQMLEGLL